MLDDTVATARRLCVGVISQWYDPEPVPLPHDLARALVDRGHTVLVVTAFPSYPTGGLTPGYRQRLGWREVRDGVTVHRVPTYLSHDRSAWRRSLTYLSFAVAGTIAARRLAGCDVVYVYATPLTTALAALVLRRVRGVPYVLHVQDLWPDAVEGAGMIGPRAARRLVTAGLRAFAGTAYRAARRVVAIAPTMAVVLQDRGVPADRLSTSYNWSTVEPVVVARSPDRRGDTTRILYAGNLGPMQDLATFVAALVEAGPIAGLEVRLAGAGTSRDDLRRLVEDAGLSHVSFVDSAPLAETTSLYAWADFSLVPLADRAALQGTVPSKLQASLAHGVPVLVTAPGDSAALVADTGCGLVAPPGDVHGLAEVIRAACWSTVEERSAFGAAARRTYAGLFARRRAVDWWEGLLSDACRS